MGSAIIKANAGNAQYTIDLDMRITEGQDAIDKIDESLQGLVHQLIAAGNQKITDELDRSNKGALVQVAITNLKAGVEARVSESKEKELWDILKNAVQVLSDAFDKVREDEKQIGIFSLQLASLPKRREMLSDAIATRTETGIWCADYSTDLTGNVGTIEVDGDCKKMLIMPGGLTKAEKLKPVAIDSPSAAAFNHSIMPAWQKWKPTYRFATLIGVDYKNNTCNLIFDDAVSKIGNFNINQGSSYTAPSTSTVPGWDDFAKRYPGFPLLTNTSGSTIPLTSQLRSDLTAVNNEVNRRCSYRSDVGDTWDLMSIGGAGDCEDFALTKAKKLIDLGYPASAIHIEVGKMTDGVGHAWLVVSTSEGDLALDINYQSVILDSKMNYTDRIRQSGMNWKKEGSWTENVPIEYMTCKAHSFLNGDRVVVAFTGQEWGAPKVIGFASNPRPCPTFVKLHITSCVNNPLFIGLCNDRIAELQRDKDFAIYCKDVFIPQIEALLLGWIGGCKVFFEVCWVRYTAYDYEADYQPYKAWKESTMGANHDLGYNSYVAALDLMIQRWTFARTYFQAMLTYSVGDFKGGDPDFEVSAAPITDFAMWIDAKQQDSFLDPSVIDQFNQGKLSDSQRMTFLSDVAAKYALIDSPEYRIKLYIPGFFEWRWRCKGVLDKDQRFFLISTGYAYEFAGLPGGQLETLVVNISLDTDRSLFEYPTPVQYNVAWWTIGAKNIPTNTSLAVRIKGKLHATPTEFGATVIPDTDLKGTGYVNIDKISQTAWMWPAYRDGIQNGIYAPRGFEDFAGRYPDHPLVTGVDLLPESYRLGLGDPVGDLLAYVQNYVQSHYTYLADDISFDNWTFLTPQRPAGDCEDFAITKANLLLNFGVPVARLALETGTKQFSFNPKRYDSEGNEIFDYIGHAWLVVDGTTALDLPGIQPVSASRDAYPLNIRTQISGLHWLLRGTMTEVDAIPQIYYDYNLPVVTLGGTISRKDH